MRVRVAALTGALLLCSTLPFAPAGAARPPLRCRSVVADGNSFRICSGTVVSPDKVSRIEVSVTLPGRGDGPFPLVVMLHGLGGEKDSYMSPTVAGQGGRYHFNNLWFAARGYAVMNHTARGYLGADQSNGSPCVDTSVESVDGDPQLYPPSPACRAQLSHVRYDVADTRYLVGRAVDGTLLRQTEVAIAPRKVAVAGVSLGGGQAWLLSRRNTWRSPEGRRVRLAAAVPIIGWTDLVDSLLPNGQARDDVPAPTDPALREAQPAGVAKASTIENFYALLQISSVDSRVPGYLTAWRDRFRLGPPYDDEVARDAIHKLLVNRSAYYVPKAPPDVPVLAVQGFTDFPFPAIEAVRMLTRYAATDEGVPLRAYFGDYGHPIAQNKTAESDYIADLVTAWIDRYLAGRKGAAPGKVEARLVDCASAQPGALYRAGSWDALSDRAALFALEMDGALDSAAADPHAARLDPMSEPAYGCRVTDTAVASGNLAAAVAVPGGLTMLGMPEVSFRASPSAADMYVAAHLFDVDPATGMQTLVDRGVVRLGASGGPADVTFQLFGSGYRFGPGHLVKLELTANDHPSFERPVGGTIGVSGVSLRLPEADPAALVP